MKKFLIAFAMLPTISFASNSDLKVTANVEAGCVINASNFHFADLNFIDGSLQETPGTLDLQCSKDTNIVISQSSLNYSHNYVHGLLKHNTKTGTGTTMRLLLNVIGSVDNNDMVFIRRPYKNFLGRNYSAQENYSMTVKFLTNNNYTFNINANLGGIYEDFNSKIVPGDYSETLTYTFKF